jgi:hypothetical protein
VAQALLPYPQYCSSLTGLNENLGSSTYHSLQLKAEKRFSKGFYLMANYTWSKLITDAASTTQSNQAGYGRIGSVITPFEKSRNKSLSTDDVPQNFALMAVYELPFGRGKQFLNRGGFVDKLLGGWSVSTSMKLTSGMPLFFNSGTCNVPGQFRVACIPGVIPGQNPFLQSVGSVDVNKPLFNVNAFEPATSFNFYYGKGERVTNYRGSGFRNQDLALSKDINIAEKVKIVIRAEAFNMWNAHYFTCGGQLFEDCTPFQNDISASDFGQWTGSITTPRNIQLVGRITF